MSFSVLSGCAVTAQSTPNMTVAVASGRIGDVPTATALNTGFVLQYNTTFAVTSGNVTITTADAAIDRLDCVVADNTSGAKSVIAGPTNDGANVHPADTTGFTILKYVYVFNQASASYTGTIVSGVLFDTWT